MNTLKDVIGMGGGLFEEAYNIGRRDALRETGAEDLQATVTALEAANKVLGDKLEEANGRIERLNTELDEVSVENERLRERLETETELEPKPKPCPFCGGRPDVVAINKEKWVVSCHSDTCAVNPETDAFDTAEEAVSAWNHRAGELTCDWR